MFDDDEAGPAPAPRSRPTPGPQLPARPSAPTWRERVESLADATGVTPGRLAVGVVAVAVAAAAAWWLLRTPGAPAELAIPFTSTASTVTSPAANDGGTGVAGGRGETVNDPAEVVVHVAGAVVRPGLVRLRAGARVADAVEAAGGLAGDADLDRFNLAALLQDGARLYVPRVGQPVPAEVGPGAAGTGVSGAGTLSLNTATAADLEALPGVGPATAEAIVAHRAQIGRFDSVDQLLDVRGIGEAKLEQIRPLVTVG